MKILILGLGQQGKASLHHLARSADVKDIIAADINLKQAENYVNKFGKGKAKCVKVNARNRSAVLRLMSSGVDAVIDLLPRDFTDAMAKLAVEAGVHLINTVYVNKEIQKLDAEANNKGIAILPEFGLDPGIDLVMCAAAVREFDEVHELYSYGGGIPEPGAADNPLKYKITWTLDGVLGSYKRPAHILKDNKVINIKAAEIFAEQNIHSIHVDKLGNLEAFPNGDALKYIDLLGIGGKIKTMGRFALRWPGHCAFWKKLVDLNFLEDEPVQIGSIKVVPREFLCNLLESQLQYKEQERDVVILRIDVRGIKDSKKIRIVYDMVDYRDLSTGLMAMNRTVGYTASIGAQMLIRNDIKRKGVLSPVKDVDSGILFNELEKCGIRITKKEES